MPEQWRVIDGWPQYEVSNLGRVRSWNSYHDRPLPHVMRPQQFTGKEYLYVCLSARGKHRKARVATLVARAFIGPRPDGLEIRHLDGNARNNRADNLAYGTHSVNMRDRRTHGTDTNLNKTHCPQGHEYTAATTMRHGPDARWRKCRTCHNDRRRQKAA